MLCESSAHIARAELGAHGAISGITMRTWTHPRGQVDLEAIRELHSPDLGPFFVPTAAVAIENTHNFAGGAVLPLDDLRARVEADPADQQARFDYATALHAGGDVEQAIEQLLEAFRRDRDWNDGAAKAQLLTIFDALKPADPLAQKGRRRLSSLIFS